MYSFSGSSQRLRYPHLSGFDNQSNFTVSWTGILDSTTGSWTAFFGQLGTASSTGNTHGWSIIRDSATSNLYVSIRNGSTAGARSYPITLSSLSTFLVSYDGTQGVESNRVKVYFNGSLVASSSGGSIPVQAATTNQGFDVASSEGGFYGKVQVAELAMWAGASLGATEAEMLATGLTPNHLPVKPTYYFPLVRETQDVSSGIVLSSTTGSPTVVAHPRTFR